MTGERGGPPNSRLLRLSTILPAVVIALLPKCPVCWAGYMALVGAAGLLSRQAWLFPAAYILLLVSLVFLREGAVLAGRRGNGPFLLALGGALLLFLSRFLVRPLAANWSGVALIATGSLWSFRTRQHHMLSPVGVPATGPMADCGSLAEPHQLLGSVEPETVLRRGPPAA